MSRVCVSVWCVYIDIGIHSVFSVLGVLSHQCTSSHSHADHSVTLSALSLPALLLLP